MSTILFSGRFDRVHVGHIITIQRLSHQYEKVLVVILDYPEQFYPIEERVNTLKEALVNSKGNYEVIVNKHNFENITKEQVGELPEFNVYGSGNFRCYSNMSKLGYEVVDTRRYPGYAAKDDRKYQKFVKFLEDEGYIDG